MNYRILSRIVDSQETASIKEARKLLVAKAGKTEEQADAWVRGDLRAAFPILRDKHAAKFILGTTRLFVDQELNNADAQNKLTRVLKEVNSEDNYDKFDRNLNGMSLGDLYSTFEEKISADDKASRDASSGKAYGKSDYEITGPFDTFKAAKAAWGNKSQDWCVFHQERMYNSYTSAGQVFYVAAKNGWESVPRKVGENAPMDEYGNSLIAISVDLKGNLATSTPRWNHANGGGDHTYTVEELESILQVPFYDTFKPETEEDVASWGEGDVVVVKKTGSTLRYFIGGVPADKSIFTRLFSLTKSGIKPKFKEPIHYYKTGTNGDLNYLRPDGTTLTNLPYRMGTDFREGFALVKKSGDAPYNYLKEDGTLLSPDRWFTYASGFHNGFGIVENDLGVDFIKPDGSLLYGKFLFDEAEDFDDDGFARVKIGEGWNFINKQGKVLNKELYSRAEKFIHGFAMVKKEGLGCNYLKHDGTYLLDKWYNSVYAFDDTGLGLIAKIENKPHFSFYYNFVKPDGTLLSDTWFNEINSDCPVKGYTEVAVDGDKSNMYNIITPDHTYLFKNWSSFIYVSEVSKNYKVVRSGDEVHRIGKKGEIIDSAWKQAMGLLKKVQL